MAVPNEEVDQRSAKRTPEKISSSFLVTDNGRSFVVRRFAAALGDQRKSVTQWIDGLKAGDSEPKMSRSKCFMMDNYRRRGLAGDRLFA